MQWWGWHISPRYFASQNTVQLMTARTVHVTDLTPGSENPTKWELLGHAGNTCLDGAGRVEPFAAPGQLPVTRCVAKLAARDGRWLAAMVRSLTLTDMHMQMCVFNSLATTTTAAGDGGNGNSSPGAVFCAAAGTILSLVLGEWIDAGSQPPSAHATTWWGCTT
jgi:hypothetical protein